MVPAILEENEDRASTMGQVARQEWERWYSPEHVFNTAADLLLEAREGIDQETLLDRVPTYSCYLQPFYFRHWLLSPLKRGVLQMLGVGADRR